MTVVSNIFLACLIASQWILLYGLCCENVLRYLGFNKKSISCDGTPAFENDAPIEKKSRKFLFREISPKLLPRTLYVLTKLEVWMTMIMMTWWLGNVFRITGPLWGESVIGGSPRTWKVSNTYHLWRQPEQTVEQTIELLIIHPYFYLFSTWHGAKDGRIFLNPVTISQSQTTTFMVHYFCSLLIFVATFGVCKMNLNVMMWYDTEYIEADWRIYAPVKQTLVQILARRLFGAKPLSEPMLSYCHLDHKERILVKFRLKFKSFHSRKYTWNCRLRNGGHFVSTSMC